MVSRCRAHGLERCERDTSSAHGELQLPFGARLANNRCRAIFLWQQISSLLLVAVRFRPRVYAPHVSSGELVLPRDQTAQGHAASQLFEGLDWPDDRSLHLDECRRLSAASPFRALVRETALRLSVEPRALAVRALLQLPRVATNKGWISRSQAQRELRIRAAQLRGDAWAVRSHLPAEKFPLGELGFEVIDPSRALPLLTSLHYLRSARRDSLYFALLDPMDRLPVSLCSVSPLEWKRVSTQLQAQFAIRQGSAWDVSRVYSVDSAPANAISLLLSRVRIYFRRNFPSADLLITVVDPNLGFTGSSYRASNWQQWMTVKARPYLYENDQHVTPRQLRERYNTASLIELQGRFPGRFQQSKVRLLDSMIYCCSVNGGTKAVPAQERRRLRR